MPAFHLLRCNIALGGDKDNIVYRDRSRPIVFPELPVLQFIHGEDAVTDVYVVGKWETNNQEVLNRLDQLYSPEVRQAVFHGPRPQLPLGDPSVPPCTLKVYKPRPVEPESPDPKLRPLDQFTMPGDDAELSPPLPPETEATPEEIAAHTQDHEEAADLGLGPVVPPLGDLPHIVRDTLGRGSSRRALARPSGERPDVNAGMSHPPGHVQNYGG